MRTRKDRKTIIYYDEKFVRYVALLFDNTFPSRTRLMVLDNGVLIFDDIEICTNGFQFTIYKGTAEDGEWVIDRNLGWVYFPRQYGNDTYTDQFGKPISGFEYWLDKMWEYHANPDKIDVDILFVPEIPPDPEPIDEEYNPIYFSESIVDVFTQVPHPIW